MTNRRAYPLSSRRGRRGFLALLVMVLLAFFGLVAGLQVLLHASAGLSSRALEFRRQRLLLDRLFEQSVRESLLAHTDVAEPPSEALPDTLVAKLELMGLHSAQVSLCPYELPELRSFPSSDGQIDTLLSPSEDLLALAGPDLRSLVGDRVAEYRLSSFDFEISRPVLGGTTRHRLSLAARLAAVPLARQGRVAYDLPSEIAATSSASAASVSDSLGLVPSRDGAASGGLRSRSDALPGYFRHRASLASAYQKLFSQAFVDRVALLASPTRFLDLDADASQAPVLTGLTRTSDGAVFDLGLAGHGSWNGVEEDGRVFLLVSKNPGRVLSLVDTQARDDLAPLVVVAVGGEPGGLVVDLGMVSRSVLLVAFNATVRASPGTVFKGALFLSPSCAFSSEGGRVDFAHFSYWGGSADVDWRSVHASISVAFALEELSPRAVYAAVGRTEP